MKKIKLGIQGKFIILFFILAVLLISGIGYSAYTLNYRQVEQQYLSLAKSSVEMAAELINGDSIPGYLENGANEEYEITNKRLQALKISYGLKYLYVLVPDTQENGAVYAFDAFKPGDDPELVAELGEPAGVIDIYDLALELFLTGHTQQSTVITSSKYGYLASAYAPVFDSTGKPAAVVGADIEMGVIMAEVRAHTIQILLMAVAIIVIFLLIILFVVNRQMIHPIKALSSHMEHFASDKEHLSEEHFTVHTRDEIEKMADSFNSMVGDIKRYTENLASVTADRERIATELNVATQIQASMLPSIFPAFPNREEFDIFATMEPAKEVGGDFYDFFMIDEKRLGVVIADVSGKGVPAALFMVIAKTLIKNQAGYSVTPSDALNIVNEQLLESNEAGLFVTVFIGVLEIDTGRFSYSNAGHNAPLIYRKGRRYEWLKADVGFVLAGWEGFQFKTEELILEPGDRLFFYTDGVTEALNPAEELFGDDRLYETLNRQTISDMGLQELVGYVRNEMEAFTAGAEQADDITMMVLSFDQKMDRRSNEHG